MPLGLRDISDSGISVPDCPQPSHTALGPNHLHITVIQIHSVWGSLAFPPFRRYRIRAGRRRVGVGREGRAGVAGAGGAIEVQSARQLFVGPTLSGHAVMNKCEWQC